VTRDAIRDRNMQDREQLERWLASEATGQEDAADAAFAHLFAAVPKVEPGAEFVDRTTARVWGERTRRRRVAVLGWAAAVVLAAAGSLAGYLAAAPVSAWAVKTGVQVMSHAMPWLVAYATEAMTLWWVAARVGNHIAIAIATPPRAAALVAVELVGIFAFFALQRLVRLELRGEAHV
jgi:hypothetical protein